LVEGKALERIWWNDKGLTSCRS